MNRRKLLLNAYRATPTAQVIPFEVFLEVTSDYHAYPIDYMGDVIGAVITRGAEIHLSAWRRPPGSMRKLVHQVLQDTVDRWGYAKTAVMKDNAVGLAFCRRLGFEVEGEEATDYGPICHLTCRRARHA